MVKSIISDRPQQQIYLQKMQINYLTCDPLTRLFGWVLRVGGSQHSPRTEGAGYFMDFLIKFGIHRGGTPYFVVWCYCVRYIIH